MELFHVAPMVVYGEQRRVYIYMLLPIVCMYDKATNNGKRLGWVGRLFRARSRCSCEPYSVLRFGSGALFLPTSTFDSKFCQLFKSFALVIVVLLLLSLYAQFTT